MNTSCLAACIHIQTHTQSSDAIFLAFIIFAAMGFFELLVCDYQQIFFLWKTKCIYDYWTYVCCIHILHICSSKHNKFHTFTNQTIVLKKEKDTVLCAPITSFIRWEWTKQETCEFQIRTIREYLKLNTIFFCVSLLLLFGSFCFLDDMCAFLKNLFKLQYIWVVIGYAFVVDAPRTTLNVEFIQLNFENILRM